MAKKIIKKILEVVAGIAVVICFLAPVTRYLGLVAFVASTIILLACFVGLRFLDDDTSSGWWPAGNSPKP